MNAEIHLYSSMPTIFKRLSVLCFQERKPDSELLEVDE